MAAEGARRGHARDAASTPRTIQDQVELAAGTRREASGARRAQRPAAAADQGLLLGEGRTSCCGLSLQCFGGSGYCQDYPIEQYIRDQKIDSLYEGTTHIQALDLFFRKIARDQGRTLAKLGEEILQTVKGGVEELETERELLGRALDDAQQQVGTMVGHLMAAANEPAEIYRTGLHANSLLESMSEVTIGWLLLRHAEVALAALPGATGADRDFYEGKVAAARWFARNVLPKATLRRRAAEVEDGALMDLPDTAF